MAVNMSRTSTIIHHSLKLYNIKTCNPYFSVSCSRIYFAQNNDLLVKEASKRSFSSSTSVFRSVQVALDDISGELTAAGVPEPQVSSGYLLSQALGCQKQNDYKKYLHQELTHTQEEELGRLVACRLARMPLQYIAGNWDFRYITLQVRPPVFIPRPETEQLVELVLNNIPLTEVHQLRILEVGPGCGNICLSLLKENENLHVTALDRSRMAVDLTKENAKLLGLDNRLEVFELKVEDNTTLPDNIGQHLFHAIVSNPPYVLRKDLVSLDPEISIYEDLRALDGGAEGLDVIISILRLAVKYLIPGGNLFLEVDPCHPHILPDQLIKQGLPFTLKETIQDFRGKDRFLILEKDPI